MVFDQRTKSFKTGKESEWSMDVNANFTGGALDQMNGSLRLKTFDWLQVKRYIK